ncbi:MAG: PilZ domain-containing protein [Bryobacteraceae bacterium]
MAPRFAERRARPRIPVDQSVSVTILGPSPETVPGTVADVSGSGLRLIVTQSVPVSALIRIDGFGSMLLGEVCRSQWIADAWHLGVILEHVLENADEFAAIAAF